MRLEDAPRNHWIRLADGTLMRYYDLDGGLARCQRLDGRMVNLSPSTEVMVVRPLGYDDAEY